jgi:hypothetical protein
MATYTRESLDRLTEVCDVLSRKGFLLRDRTLLATVYTISGEFYIRLNVPRNAEVIGNVRVCAAFGAPTVTSRDIYYEIRALLRDRILVETV